VPPGEDISNVDLPGGDLKPEPILLQQADPALCRQACEAEGQCKAYTYVKPGVQGPAAACWLKSSVPPPVTNACCISGVKVAAGPTPEPPPPAAGETPERITPEETEPAPASNCPPATENIQRIVYGWSQYKRTVEDLPPDQQANLTEVGELLKSSFQSGCTPVSTVEVQGHADYDTPRNQQREQQYSEERAQAAADWLRSYVGASIAEQIGWDTKGLGATQLKAEPTTEANRKQNRRVEILGYYSSSPTCPECAVCVTPQDREMIVAGSSSAEFNASISPETVDLSIFRTPAIDQAINDFCQRLGGSTLDLSRFWCGPLVDEAINKIKKTCVATRTSSLFIASRFLQGQDCKAADRYLVVKYEVTRLAKAVEVLKQELDSGCVVKAGVLAGRCPDNLDQSCRKNKKVPASECPEHWILIIGHDDNSFVFWDPNANSAFDGCQGTLIPRSMREFGLLFYDDVENHLSTAPQRQGQGSDQIRVKQNKIPYLDGHHINLYPDQKRFQVLILRPPSSRRP
jgi:outer membrane protein OmpA-like peptidoglycan-associated protein